MKKVHVLFGGSSGIGFETAKLFNDGALVIADINEDTLSSSKLEFEKLGIDTHTIKCDITNKEDVAQVAKLALSLGELKTIVNTAGVSSYADNPSLIMSINLVGASIIINEFLKHAKEGVAIVNLSSMLGYTTTQEERQDDLLTNALAPNFMEKAMKIMGDDSNIAYRVSKYGVRILTENQAKAWGDKGARIVSVSPGIIKTPMSDKVPKEVLEGMKQQTPLKRRGTPEEVAKLIYFLASDDASFITGLDVRIDGGLVGQLMKQ